MPRCSCRQTFSIEAGDELRHGIACPAASGLRRFLVIESIGHRQ
jgi:hypothetical protein